MIPAEDHQQKKTFHKITWGKNGGMAPFLEGGGAKNQLFQVGWNNSTSFRVK